MMPNQWVADPFQVGRKAFLNVTVILLNIPLGVLLAVMECYFTPINTKTFEILTILHAAVSR